MEYKKIIVSDYILGLAEVINNGNISKEEYDRITEIIRNKPSAESGYDYRLRADSLEWELVEVPVIDEQPEDEATIEDYEEAIGRFGA